MLVRNDTLFVSVHHLFQMLCTNPEAYVGWRPFWICMKIGHLPWRDFWGFSIVGRCGTNELISGEKPFIAILSNLRVYFVVRLPDYVGVSPERISIENVIFLPKALLFLIVMKHISD